MDPLTDRQTRILEFIRVKISRQGCPPTVREIGTKFRIASTHGVRCHLQALEKKGYIERHFHASRGIRLTDEVMERSGLPVIGRVAAGTPIMAEENVESYLAPGVLFPDDGSCYCLKVQGDSMKDAGILDGDYAVVQKKDDFTDGKIGVAIIDGEATVKRLWRRNGKIELIPANPKYRTTEVDLTKAEFRYGGEVIGIHRIVK